MLDIILSHISRLAGVVIVVSGAFWASTAAWRSWRDRNLGQVEAYTHLRTGKVFLINRSGGIVEVKK
ncbi:MAG: hypothetical protein JXQ84_07765 [Rhodospirillaceae bacterium]|nr:hypothetical protein [Rhodospirillaceae bacterium]